MPLTKEQRQDNMAKARAAKAKQAEAITTATPFKLAYSDAYARLSTDGGMNGEELDAACKAYARRIVGEPMVTNYDGDAYAGIRGDMEPDVSIDPDPVADRAKFEALNQRIMRESPLSDERKAEIKHARNEALKLPGDGYPDNFKDAMRPFTQTKDEYDFFSAYCASNEGVGVWYALAGDDTAMQEAGAAIMGAIDEHLERGDGIALEPLEGERILIGTGEPISGVDSRGRLIPGAFTDPLNARSFHSADTFYEWLIEGKGGYDRRLRSQGIPDVTTARDYVIATNELSALERSWVENHAPEQVLATSKVTLTHAGALNDNERLCREIVDAQVKVAIYIAIALILDEIGVEHTVEAFRAFLMQVEADAMELVRAAKQEAADALRGNVEHQAEVAERLSPAVKPEPVAPIAWSTARITIPADADPRIRTEAAGAVFVAAAEGIEPTDTAFVIRELTTVRESDLTTGQRESVDRVIAHLRSAV